MNRFSSPRRLNTDELGARAQILEFPAHERLLLLARKNPAIFSQLLIEGSTTCPLAIFSMVRLDTSEPSATSRIDSSPRVNSAATVDSYKESSSPAASLANTDLSRFVRTRLLGAGRSLVEALTEGGISPHPIPIGGDVQPQHVKSNPITLATMPPKDRSVLSDDQIRARAALSAKIKSALNEEFPGMDLSPQCQRIAESTGLNYKTIFRAVMCETSPNMDTLVILARRLGRTVSELTALPVEKTVRPGVRPN